MSIISSLRESVRGLWNRVTTAARTVSSRIVHMGRTDSGVYVDQEEALKTATVWACVQYLSKTVAQLPWRVMRETAAGEILNAAHPVDYLINKRPNRELGSFSFRQTLTWWAVTWGNGYAEIEWDNRGVPYALWPIHPGRVKPLRDTAGVLFYRVYDAVGSGFVDMAAEDILHVRGFGDDAVGVSVIAYAARSIGWALATEIFGATFFGQGMNPSGIVESPTPLTPEALEILKQEMKKLYGGPKGERTAILDKGMKFNKLATQPNDAQFIETRQHQVEEICRWFGVPPHKVMHLLRATFSNIEHQSIEVVVDSITPWVKIWEEESEFKLFGARNRGSFTTRMDLNGLLRGDSIARAEHYSKSFLAGGSTVNDWLRSEGKATIGAQGDVRFIPVNMQTLDAAIAAGKRVVEGQALPKQDAPISPGDTKTLPAPPANPETDTPATPAQGD